MSDQIRRDPDYRALRAEITALRARLGRAEGALRRLLDATIGVEIKDSLARLEARAALARAHEEGVIE